MKMMREMVEAATTMVRRYAGRAGGATSVTR
jgi:hypothetical protein